MKVALVECLSTSDEVIPVRLEVTKATYVRCDGVLSLRALDPASSKKPPPPEPVGKSPMRSLVPREHPEERSAASTAG